MTNPYKAALGHIAWLGMCLGAIVALIVAGANGLLDSYSYNDDIVAAAQGLNIANSIFSAGIVGFFLWLLAGAIERAIATPRQRSDDSGTASSPD
jgi:hypothetical protein